MPQKERLGHIVADSLEVLGEVLVGGKPFDLGSLAAGLVHAAIPAGPALDGGRGLVTGSGAVTSRLAAVSSAVASLAGPPSAAAAFATASINGNVVTLSVFKADLSPATAPVEVDWIAIGG